MAYILGYLPQDGAQVFSRSFPGPSASRSSAASRSSSHDQQQFRSNHPSRHQYDVRRSVDYGDRVRIFSNPDKENRMPRPDVVPECWLDKVPDMLHQRPPAMYDVPPTYTMKDDADDIFT